MSSQGSISDSIYALIFAGGGGHRLWPLSRERKPKQFLKLFSQQTLLEQTFERISPFIPPERIFVLTNKLYEKSVRENLRQVPKEQILLEPVRRGTGPAAFLGALAIHQRDPEAVIVNIWADHKVKNKSEYLKTIKVGSQAVAHGQNLLACGITPTFPHTGLGYIKKGKKIKSDLGLDVFKLARFSEKPDRKTAEDMLDEGSYLWNVGLFIWRADAILASFRQHAPEIAQYEKNLLDSLDDGAKLAQVFAKLPAISVDQAIAEKAANFLVLEARFDWSDVGDFEVLWEELPNKDKSGNVIASGRWVGLETQGGLFVSQSGQLITTVGLTNVAVIATDDAILVVPRDDAQKVKDLVRLLEQKGTKKHL